MQRTIPLFRGLSVMVAAVVVGALWLLGGRPGVTDEEATSLNFYVEAQATVIQRSNVRLSAGIPDRPIVTTLRWWYAAKLDRWRWEIESTGTSLLGSSLIAVFDGRELWQYDGRSDTYTRTTPPPYPDGTIPLPTALSLPFGPSNTATAEEFIALFGRVAEYITVTGNERVLGRDATVIEYGPTWRTSDGSGLQRSGGTGRLWLDAERQFILRHVTDGGDVAQSAEITVTTIEYGRPIPAERVVFVPPPGAREQPTTTSRSCSSSSGGAGQGGIWVPPGFLRPSYLPHGYSTSSSSSESGRDCTTAGMEAVLAAEGGNGYILLQQSLRAGGIPEALRYGAPVEFDGREAYRQQEEGLTRLVWSDGDIVALLEADALPFEELFRVARSMTRR